ncbi:UNVERIFIED_CONTAM: hypothetical protein NY100_07195 [Prevotella sp. 15_C9]
MDKHHFAIVIGQSVFGNIGHSINGNRRRLINLDKPSINYVTGEYQTTFQLHKDGNYVPIYTMDANGNQGWRKARNIYIRAMYQHYAMNGWHTLCD